MERMERGRGVNHAQVSLFFNYIERAILLKRFPRQTSGLPKNFSVHSEHSYA